MLVQTWLDFVELHRSHDLAQQGSGAHASVLTRGVTSEGGFARAGRSVGVAWDDPGTGTLMLAEAHRRRQETAHDVLAVVREVAELLGRDGTAVDAGVSHVLAPPTDASGLKVR
jgi:hypothetical protein